jgi:uncharacterized protein (DUF58 family)
MAAPLLTTDVMRRLEQLVLTSRKLVSSRHQGERLVRRRGMSTEFADYRSYVAGDDLRFLDWKIYGRLEKLFLRQFMDEEDLRVHLLLDVSESMAHGEPEKLLYGRRVAAALAYICLVRMDRVSITTFGGGLGESCGPCHGRASARRLFDFLEAVEPLPTTAVSASLREFGQRVGRGRGLVVVISDFLDFAEYESGLRSLLARNFEVVVLHLLSPDERVPTVRGDLSLLDCETAATADVSIGPALLAQYEQVVAEFCDGLQQFVQARGGTAVTVSTALPFERLVLDTLCRHGVVR